MPRKNDPEIRYRRFAEEYIKDFNGTRSAIAAGYAEKNASVQASQLLGRLKVQTIIKELTDKRSAQCSKDNAWVLEKFIKAAQIGLGETGFKTGLKSELEHIEEMVKIDLTAANKSLENVGKHLGFYAEDNSQQGQINLNVVNYSTNIKDVKEIDG